MNKFCIVLCALVTGSFAVHAQISSGNMMVGGDLTFTSESHQGGSANDVSSVTFSPAFGYFISDRFAIGTSLSLSSSRTGTGADKTVRSSFGLGPFARYYLTTSNENFAFFGQAQISFASGKTDPPSGNVTRNNSITFALSPGAVFFFNEHWALEFALRGFSISSRDPNTDNDNDKVTRVELGLNSFSPTLGFRYHF